jgi:hypothetical protein
MAVAVYVMGILVTALCALLLLQGYAKTKQKLLLWSGLCFIGLTFSNVLLFLDLAVWTEINLYTWRLSAAAVSLLVLIYGLVWESD